MAVAHAWFWRKKSISFESLVQILHFWITCIWTLRPWSTCLCIKQDEVYKRNILIQVRFVTAYLGGVMALAPCTK